MVCVIYGLGQKPGGPSYGGMITGFMILYCCITGGIRLLAALCGGIFVSLENRPESANLSAADPRDSQPPAKGEAGKADGDETSCEVGN